MACLQLINTIVLTPDDLDFRLHLRNEFMRVGLADLLEVRKITTIKKSVECTNELTVWTSGVIIETGPTRLRRPTIATESL